MTIININFQKYFQKNFQKKFSQKFPKYFPKNYWYQTLKWGFGVLVDFGTGGVRYARELIFKVPFTKLRGSSNFQQLAS